MVLHLKHTYFKNAGPLSTACYSNTGWGSVDNYIRLETKKAVFCWLILHPRHTVVSLNKENCVCVTLHCWNIGICFWLVPVKIRFDTTISHEECISSANRNPVIHEGKVDEEGAGKRTKTKKARLCFRAIHQIPSYYSKPRYLQSFHTSFIKPCGFGWLGPDGVSLSWLSVWRGSQVRVRQQD